MNTDQKNKLTMLQTVLLYLGGIGAVLAAIKRIGAGRDALQQVVAQIEVETGAQRVPTTGVSRSREEVKAEAGQKAEVLRLLVVALTDDDTLRAELDMPMSKAVRGKDADFVRYLGRVAEAVGKVPAQDLKDSGYEAEVLATLQGDIAELTSTQGAVRQIELSTEKATEVLVDLFKQADVILEKQLDPLVRAQKLAKPGLVEMYNRSRRIIHTPARRRPRYSGTATAGAVALVYDRREAGLTDPTLGNRSGRGRTLRYYTAATATAPPVAGQGLLVKNRTDVQLANYDKLGPDPDAPFLLVALEGVDGEGHWLVQ